MNTSNSTTGREASTVVDPETWFQVGRAPFLKDVAALRQTTADRQTGPTSCDEFCRS